MSQKEAAIFEKELRMSRAIEVAASSRLLAPPNPWVGAVIVAGSGEMFEGSTAAPGGPHAEIAALSKAGSSARGSIMYVTLEPCAHHGRTGPCVKAIVASGVAHVVIGMQDPDRQVHGEGIEYLRQSGVEVSTGVLEDQVRLQLAPYIKHRETGLPWVVLKLAMTMDGRIAAPDGTSQWITGAEARADVQLLRQHSDAIAVGAGTIRIDDPKLTVRLEKAKSQEGETLLAGGEIQDGRSPLRVVFGQIPEDARVLPALELRGSLRESLAQLGERGILQLLVEGGAHLAHDLHAQRLIDRYVLYMAPAFLGGSDGLSLFEGPGEPTLEGAWRGRVISVRQLGADLRVELGGPII